ncbi:MAG: hypothetical protein ACH350_00165 [Parachlamydiaceae bacterium]
MGLLIRLLLCISFAGLVLYKYIDKLNDLTGLRLSIPILAREVKEIHEQNLELQYTIDCFESPLHLMELAEKPEFGHLKYPILDDIVLLPEFPVYCVEGQDL